LIALKRNGRSLCCYASVFGFYNINGINIHRGQSTLEMNVAAKLQAILSMVLIYGSSQDDNEIPSIICVYISFFRVTSFREQTESNRRHRPTSEIKYTATGETGSYSVLFGVHGVSRLPCLFIWDSDSKIFAS
jgi:hypothetical protein